MILIVMIFSVTGDGVSSGREAIETFLHKGRPEGWILVDGPRTYTKRSLFERIDGQAELFFKYGFQKSVFAIYQNGKRPENQIELDIYDMGNVLQAFGIFSRFRNEDRPGGVGLDSYFHENSALFYKGRYFVTLYATDPDLSSLKQFSMAVSSKISDHSPPPKEIGYFPVGGLKRGSIQYSPEGIWGHQFLKRGFQGTYVEEGRTRVGVEHQKTDGLNPGGNEFHLFLAVCKNAQEAVRALRTYKDYLTRKGKVSFDPPSGSGSNALGGEDPYQGRVIVTQENIYLVGVAGFREQTNGENLLKEFLKRVR